MTKDETMSKVRMRIEGVSALRGFVIPSSFDIRASSFPSFVA